MKQPGNFKIPVVRPSRQRGQAYAEYLVITAAVFVAGMWWFWGDPAFPSVPSVAASFKSFFSAYSFTLSLP